jgi:hypothetical protein
MNGLERNCRDLHPLPIPHLDVISPYIEFNDLRNNLFDFAGKNGRFTPALSSDPIYSVLRTALLRLSGPPNNNKTDKSLGDQLSFRANQHMLLRKVIPFTTWHGD